MKSWDIICRIAVAAEELSRCDDYIDAQGGCILRDARQLIGETVDRNLLFFMRASDAAAQERPGLHMDVSEVPEAGAGLSSTDVERFESTALHALSWNKWRRLRDL